MATKQVETAGRMRLSESAASRLLLVRAIETEDTEAAVLTRDDRRHASDAALAAARGRPGEPAHAASFLSRRSEIALERLTARYPTLAKVCQASRWPLWLSLGLPLLALALGLSTDAFAGERLNIVAFPLLGLIAWNVGTYLLLAVRWLMRKWGARRSSGPIERTLAWVIRPAGTRLATQPTLERGVVRFAGDWAEAARGLTEARVRRTLHLGAALFALGVVAAMLLRARYMAEYEAGWAGTWAGAEGEIAALLGVILGPASWLTGIALPSADQLRQLRGGEQNAGNWLILWAVTATLLVILPRLVLALLSGGKAAVLKRRLPIREDFYFRSLLRNALGQPGKARVVPYGVEPEPDARERLQRVLGAALGEKVSLRIDPPVPYGEEDAWVTAEARDLTSSDHLILLFSLSSTPEAENHGAFAAAIRQRLAGSPTSLMVLLEEGRIRRRLQGQPSAERRYAERLQGWRTVLAGAGVEPTAVSLEAAAEDDTARALERALLRTPAEVR